MHHFLKFSLLTIALGIASACSDAKFQESIPVTPPKPKPEPSILPNLDAKQPIATKPKRMAASFPSTLIREESLGFTLDTKSMSTSFRLEDRIEALHEEQQQESRRSFTETHTQGRPALERLESFSQKGKKGAVDILIVIDNSNSMTEEQLNLSTKMHELISALAESDWQIGIITTSPVFVNGQPQCKMQVVKSSDPDPASMFQSAILAGIDGNRTEYGFLQAVVGLSCATAPWVRSDSTLAVLIVSDEDNCSDQGSGCRGEAGENEQYLIDYVEKDLGRDVGKNVGFYGIFSPPSAPCRTSLNAGVQYQRLVDYKSLGLSNSGNICDPSYKDTLNRISENIALLLPAEFGLSTDPVAGTISLELIDAQGRVQSITPEAYSVNGRSITFAPGQEPPNGSQLRARYLIPGIPMFQALNPGTAPAADSLEVRINGTLLDAAAYRLEAGRLIFEETPPALASVQLSYRENIPLKKTFALQAHALPDTIAVSVDGQISRDFSLNSTTLHFTKPPRDGALVEIDYKYRAGPELSYALPLPEHSSQYQLFDGQEPLSFSEEGGVITIAAADHEAGKTLTLRYESPDGTPKNFALAHPALNEGATIEGDEEFCRLGAGVELAGSELRLSCAVPRRTDFVLHYLYSEPQRSFALPGIADPEQGTWEVFADQQPIHNYEREGSLVKLTYEPEAETIITLQYTWAR